VFRNAENELYKAIGRFSTIRLPLEWVGFRDSDTPQATQCTAFLCSSREFTWFIESWEVNRDGNSLAIENKKVYPAKVTGLNLASPLPFDPQHPSIVETVAWREGLTAIGSTSLTPGYRPGFGQHILSDISRPLLTQSIPQTDLLGTGSNPAYATSYRRSFSRQLGRLMSMAFYIDPIAAARYDASKSKKKKKSLNEQDYQQIPVYPEYLPWDDGGGGYGSGY